MVAPALPSNVTNLLPIKAHNQQLLNAAAAAGLQACKKPLCCCCSSGTRRRAKKRTAMFMARRAVLGFEVVAAGLGGAVVADDGEPVTAVQETMRRMDYERKISASLYTLSGVSECLPMRLGAGAAREQLSGLREACRKKQQEQEKDPSTAIAAAEDGKAKAAED
ncbi:hypothetical protein ABZP36_033411 [Zizania latifolia]